MNLFTVVVLDGGLLQEVKLFRDREQALERGRAEYEELTGARSMVEHGVLSDRDPTGAAGAWNHREARDEPDYDEAWGGVARGHVMHWWTDSIDVIVEAVDLEEER